MQVKSSQRSSYTPRDRRSIRAPSHKQLDLTSNARKDVRVAVTWSALARRMMSNPNPNQIVLETRSGTNGGVDAGLNRRQYPLHKHTRAGTKVPCDRVRVGATERLRLNARGLGRVRDALSVGITGARRCHGVEHRRVVVRAPNASAAWR